MKQKPLGNSHLKCLSVKKKKIIVFGTEMQPPKN